MKKFKSVRVIEGFRNRTVEGFRNRTATNGSKDSSNSSSISQWELHNTLHYGSDGVERLYPTLSFENEEPPAKVVIVRNSGTHASTFDGVIFVYGSSRQSAHRREERDFTTLLKAYNWAKAECSASGIDLPFFSEEQVDQMVVMP